VYGYTVVVTEAQSWAALSRACKQAGIPESSLTAIDEKATHAVLGLMAEDVYRDIINSDADDDLRRLAVHRLMELWDARPHEIIDNPSTALFAVWASRQRHPPMYGTLLGSSELLGLSMSLDERWFVFGRDCFRDTEVVFALEEFLFGLSHEELVKVKAWVEEHGPLDGAGVNDLLEGKMDYPDAATHDPRDLYRFYEARRNAARARFLFHNEGAKGTLEEYYLRWTLENQGGKTVY
jgi:hypothetical protein